MTNTTSGWIDVAMLTSTGVWTTASDRRLKHAIEPLEDVLENALAIEPVSYFFNSEDPACDPRSIGFIAQDVQARFPSLVLEDEELLSLNYAGVNVVALGGVIELFRETQRDLDQFEARLSAVAGDLEQSRKSAADRLEARIADSRARLEALASR